MRERVFSSHEAYMRYNVDVRVYVDRLFSWQRDVYCVGMASGAVVGLVEVNFVCRVLI
jgi:hypothetical protein